MKTNNDLPELKQQLARFQNHLIVNIAGELKRINRRVYMRELPFVPFANCIKKDIDCIYLDDQSAPTIEVPFLEYKRKSMHDFIAEKEMDHWDLISLFEMLQDFFPVESNPPLTFSLISEEEYISFYEKWDNWVCLCKNGVGIEGFQTCDQYGEILMATIGSGWEDLYRCARCGRIFSQLSHKIIGINTDPNPEE